MYYDNDDIEPTEFDEFRKQFSTAMDYVVAALLVLIIEVAVACWFLWQILSNIEN